VWSAKRIARHMTRAISEIHIMATPTDRRGGGEQMATDMFPGLHWRWRVVGKENCEAHDKGRSKRLMWPDRRRSRWRLG
jgi:hypothetical protein